MRRIALCLGLLVAIPSFAIAQQGAGSTKQNVEKTDKRANFGGKASQQRGGNNHTTETSPPSTPANKQQP